MNRPLFYNPIFAFCILLSGVALLTACTGSGMSDAPEMSQSSVSQTKSLMSRIADNTFVRFGKDELIMNVKSEDDAHKRLAGLISPFSATSRRGENNEEEHFVKDATGTYKIIYLLAPDDPDYFSYALVRNSANETLKTIKFRKPTTRSFHPRDVNLWDAVHLTTDQVAVVLEDDGNHCTSYDKEIWGDNEPNALCIKKTDRTVTLLYLSKYEYENQAGVFDCLLNSSQMTELGNYLRANKSIFLDHWNKNIKNPVDFDKMYWLSEKYGFLDAYRRTQNLNGKQDSNFVFFVGGAKNPYLLKIEVRIDVIVVP